MNLKKALYVSILTLCVILLIVFSVFVICIKTPATEFSQLLFFAASIGDIAQVDHLLNSGAHVNAKCSGGGTPLHIAA